jgi:hypothetical protein
MTDNVTKYQLCIESEVLLTYLEIIALFFFADDFSNICIATQSCRQRGSEGTTKYVLLVFFLLFFMQAANY